MKKTIFKIHEITKTLHFRKPENTEISKDKSAKSTSFKILWNDVNILSQSFTRRRKNISTEKLCYKQ